MDPDAENESMMKAFSREGKVVVLGDTDCAVLCSQSVSW